MTEVVVLHANGDVTAADALSGRVRHLFSNVSRVFVLSGGMFGDLTPIAVVVSQHTFTVSPRDLPPTPSHHTVVGQYRLQLFVPTPCRLTIITFCSPLFTFVWFCQVYRLFASSRPLRCSLTIAIDKDWIPLGASTHPLNIWEGVWSC